MNETEQRAVAAAILFNDFEAAAAANTFQTRKVITGHFSRDGEGACPSAFVAGQGAKIVCLNALILCFQSWNRVAFKKKKLRKYGSLGKNGKEEGRGSFFKLPWERKGAL